MDSDFKINVFFNEKGEELENIVSEYLKNLLNTAILKR